MESKTTRPDVLEHVLPWFLVMLVQCERSATIHLDKGQNIDEIDPYDGKTALNMAAAGGHLGLVRLLLSRGADITIADFTGRTPLMWAAEKNQLAIVNVLLAQRGQHGAWHKAAALWLATRTGNPEIVRVLLADGANDEGMVYKNQGTARQLAAARREGDECLAIMQWFQDEARRCRMLHKARRLHGLSTRMSALPDEDEPWSLFFDRLLGNTPLPQLHLGHSTAHGKRKRDESEEEERDAVLRFLIQDLPEELYTELQAGMWVEGHPHRTTHAGPSPGEGTQRKTGGHRLQHHSVLAL